MEMREVLLYFTYKYKGVFKDMIQAIQNKEPVDEQELSKYEEQLKYEYITLIDDDYPDNFKNLLNPPLVLFYKGDKTLLQGHNIMFFNGDETTTESNVKTLVDFIPYLAANNVIVGSVLKKGVGRTVQDLNHHKSVVVTTTGFDHIKDVKLDHTLCDNVVEKGGVIITECPPFVRANDSRIIRGNEIAACLSSKVVLLPGQETMDTIFFVSSALRQGKEVCCVPGSLYTDSICNHLIKDGATIITKKEDLLELDALSN